MAGIKEAPGVVPQKKRAPKAVEAWAIMMIKVVPAIPVLSGKDRGDRIFRDQAGARHHVLRPGPEGRMVDPTLNLLPFRKGERTGIPQAAVQEAEAARGVDTILKKEG